jgi:lysophospholipase
LIEANALAARPAPKTPILTFLGTNERIVRTKTIHQRMQTWENGTLVMVEGAEHEILMERPEIRNDAFDKMAKLFTAHT